MTMFFLLFKITADAIAAATTPIIMIIELLDVELDWFVEVCS